MGTLEEVVGTADIFITTTGNKGILMADTMAKMKNNAIVGNIGHFDNEIDMDGLQKMTTRINIKPQVEKFTFYPKLWTKKELDFTWVLLEQILLFFQMSNPNMLESQLKDHTNQKHTGIKPTIS